MKTFNNLHTNTHSIKWDKPIRPQLNWGTNRSVAEQLEAIGDLGIVLPKMSRADAKRVDKLTKMGTIKTLKSAMARSEYTTSERLDTLLKLLGRLDKLNAGVLNGGARLKAALIETVWLVYAKVEAHGVANDHYMETGIPCNDYGTLNFGHDGSKKVLIFDCITNARRGLASLPDSELEPESQWLALELADRFTSIDRPTSDQAHGRHGIDYGDRSECRDHANPISTSTPEWFGGFQPEPMIGGQGSGLPFEPVAEPTPAEEPPRQRRTDPERFDQSARDWNRKGARIWPVNS